MIVKNNYSMAEYCSFKAGGCVNTLYIPENLAELKALVLDLNKKNEKYLVMGKGSNILFSDKGCNLSVILIGKEFSEIKIEGCKAIAGAGCNLGILAVQLAKAGLGGFEFASGIPGSLGGAVSMNGGAYGHEMAECVVSVTSVARNGEITIRSGKDCNFGYRQSVYRNNGEIIIGAELQFAKAPVSDIEKEMARLNALRKEKQPLQYPSAGSFFKRPAGNFAGKLIEEAGCKGLSVGGAQVSEKHAGFIINKGGASVTDILNLARQVRSIVEEKFDIRLENEVYIVGEEL